MQQLTQGFEALQLEYVPSYGNFVLVKVGPAARVYQELLRRGVIVRPVANYQLPEWLRVSIGLPAREPALPRRVARRAGRGAFVKLALIGVGLIGGSFARAVLAAGEVTSVVGFDADAAALAAALDLNAITEIADSAAGRGSSRPTWSCLPFRSARCPL